MSFENILGLLIAFLIAAYTVYAVDKEGWKHKFLYYNLKNKKNYDNLYYALDWLRMRMPLLCKQAKNSNVYIIFNNIEQNLYSIANHYADTTLNQSSCECFIYDRVVNDLYDYSCNDIPAKHLYKRNADAAVLEALIIKMRDEQILRGDYRFDDWMLRIEKLRDPQNCQNNI